MAAAAAAAVTQQHTAVLAAAQEAVPWQPHVKDFSVLCCYAAAAAAAAVTQQHTAGVCILAATCKIVVCPV
jgi:hypothetical protein